MKASVFASFAALAVVLLCSPALAEDYGKLNWDNSTKHLVVEKAPSEWAAKGVKPGDRIYMVDGVKLVNLSQACARLKMPGTVKLSLLRDGWENEIEVPSVSLERLGLAPRTDVPTPTPTPTPEPKVEPQGKKSVNPEVLKRAVARLKAAGFTDEQIKLLLEMFELELRDVMLGFNNHNKLLESGFSSEQAKALLKTFKLQGEPAPEIPEDHNPDNHNPSQPAPDKPAPDTPESVKTVEDAKQYALSKGVPEDAIDKLIELGKRLQWSDEKIIENILNLAKMKTKAETPDPVPQPKMPQGMPKMQQGPKMSEFSPTMQEAIQRTVERTKMPAGMVMGIAKQMLSKGMTEQQVIQMLDGMKAMKPSSGGGSPFGPAPKKDQPEDENTPDPE